MYKEHNQFLNIMAAPEENKLDLRVQNVRRINRTPEAAQAEARKVSTMLGANSPGMDVLERDIMAGDEQFWKDEAARRHSSVEEQNRINLISQIVQNGPVDERQLGILSNLTQQQFEEMEGQNFFDTEYGKTFVEENVADLATVAEDVDDTEYVRRNQNTVSWTAKYQGLYDLLDELQNEQSQAGLFTRVTDTLEGFVPLLSQIRTSGRIGDADSLLAGNNLAEQVENFHFMPYDEAMRLLREEVGKLKGSNYNDAIRLVGAMISYGQGERGVDNLFTVLDTADIATLGLAGGLRMGSKSARALSRRQAVEVTEGAVDEVPTTTVPEVPEATQLPSVSVSGGLRSTPSPDRVSSPVADIVSRPHATIRSRPNRARITSENSAGVYKATMRAATRRDPKPELVYDDIGFPDQAAMSAVELELQNLRGGRELMSSAPSLFRIGDMLRDGSNMSSITIDRLKASTRRLLNEAVGNQSTIQRTNASMLKEAVQRAKDDIVNHFSNVNQSVLNAARFVTRNETDDIAGLNTLSIQFGRGDGELFQTRDEAQAFVDEFIRPKTNDYRIQQKGYGYYAEFTKNVDESLTSNSMELPIENLSQGNALNHFIGRLRTPKDVVSKDIAEARNVAVHGTQQFNQILFDSLKPLFDLRGPLSRNELRDMEKVLGVYRDKMDPVTGKTGAWDRSIPDFMQTFKDRTGKLPTEKQKEAYFAFVRAYDLDYTLRNLNWYRDRARLGVEEISPRGIKTQDGKDFMFEGRVEREIDWNNTDDRTNIGIIQDGKIRNIAFANKDRRAEINKMLEEDGYQVIRVADPSISIPGMKPFTKYVLTRDFKRDRLTAKRTEYRGGGHKINKYRYMVKTPKFTTDETGRRFYTGDDVLFTAPTGKQAQKIAGIFEDARKVHANGGDVDEFLRVRFPHAQGRRMADYIKKHPEARFVRADSGVRSVDATNDMPEYINTKNTNDNLYSEIDSRFSQERSDESADVLREEDGVINPYNADGLVDPFTALSQGLRGIIEGKHLNNLKVKSAQDFVSEFDNILDYPRETLRTRPMEILMADPSELKFKKGADVGAMNLAKSAHSAAQHILRQQMPEIKFLDNFKETITENLFETGKMPGVVLDRLEAAKTANAMNFIKSVAFDMSMGLFNWVQFPMQAQTIFTTLAISPIQGTKAVIMSLMENTQRINRNPALTDNLDALMTSRVGNALGLRRGDYKMFKDAFEESGFNIVGGDYAMLDDFVNPSLTDSASLLGKARTVARTPFTEGERIVRSMSWFTAASEWRAKNPYGKLTAAAKREILNRADDLSINMGAQNNAAYQRGLMSIPTQFMGFFARYGELMFGKRLTRAEKLRVVAANSVLYGLPTGLGTAMGLTAVLPISDMVDKRLLAEKENLRQMGIDIDNNGYMEAMRDGLPAVIAEYVTGVDIDTGRYEPGGNPFLWDLWANDTGFIEALAGAGGNALARAWGSTVPLIRAITNEDLDVSADNFLDIFRSASSLDMSIRAYMYIKYKEWETRTGKTFKVTDDEAFWMTLTGANVERINESYSAAEIMRSDSRNQQVVLGEAEKVLRRMMLRDIDDGQFSQEFDRLNTYYELLGYTPSQRNEFFRRTIRNQDDFELINERMQKYYERKDRRN